MSDKTLADLRWDAMGYDEVPEMDERMLACAQAWLFEASELSGGQECTVLRFLLRRLRKDIENGRYV